METKQIQITIEDAREMYKQGGKFRDIALSAFDVSELTQKQLPKTWEEFCESYEFTGFEHFIDSDSQVDSVKCKYHLDSDKDRNVLPTEEAAESVLALIQLYNLRNSYWRGVKPSIDGEDVFHIIVSDKRFHICSGNYISSFLCFKNYWDAYCFLKNYIDLIRKASEFIVHCNTDKKEKV